MKMQLNCPLPKFDYDVVTQAHGSGGELTHRLLNQMIFNLLGNDILNRKHDGAFLNLSGKTAFSTDSFVISPFVFPGGNIGELAVNGTANDIAMCGAVPKFLSLSLIIEEGLKMEELWNIIASIKQAAEVADVKIVTGDTKVVEKGKGDNIFINTTGIGSILPKARIDAGRIIPGDRVFVSGNIATHGIAIMSVRKGLEFETAIESDTQNLNFLVKELIEEFGEGIKFFRDPTRGGLAGSLCETARDTGLGIEIYEKQLSVLPQVNAACEMLGFDPLYVANEGVFICIVDAAVAADFEKKLKNHSKGKNGALIGKITREHPQKVVMNSRIGGKRIVNMLAGEQLPRIC